MTKRKDTHPLEKAALERHAAAVGEIVLAWNDLHEHLSFIFSTILAHPHPLVAHALWTTLANDAAQRDLFLAALEMPDIGPPPRIREKFKWAIKQLGGLAVYRNDIVHGSTGFLINDKGVEMGFSVSGNSLKRLIRHRHGPVGIGLPEVMSMLRDDLRRIDDYVSDVWRSMPPMKLRTSPCRPRLRLLEAIGRAIAQEPRPPHKKARKRQRKSSSR